MTASTKPKRTLLAYCALAERLNKPGAGVVQAMTPFLAEACHAFRDELFDAGKFSAAVAEKFGIRIPRLAALGLADHLEKEGLLTAVSYQTMRLLPSTDTRSTTWQSQTQMHSQSPSGLH